MDCPLPTEGQGRTVHTEVYLGNTANAGDSAWETSDGQEHEYLMMRFVLRFKKHKEQL